MALALVLVTGPGLMIRSVAALQVQPGVDSTERLTFRIALPPKYSRPAPRLAFLREMEDALRVIPGVSDVALTSRLPLTGSGPLTPSVPSFAAICCWSPSPSACTGRSACGG